MMFVDVDLGACYAARVAETDAGSAGMRPAEGYATRAGAGGLSSSTPAGVRFFDRRQQRLDADADAARAHFATLCERRVCGCGASFTTFKFTPRDLPCTSCITASRRFPATRTT
jgi:hypothetical protein